MDIVLEKTCDEQERALEILETEWPDYKDVWEKAIQRGDSPAKALGFLKSFA